MNKVTADQLKDAMIEKGIFVVDHHPCGLCGYMTKYVRSGNRIWFDRGCDCMGNGQNFETRSWQDAANWINMQSNPAVQQRLAREFGLEV